MLNCVRGAIAPDVKSGPPLGRQGTIAMSSVAGVKPLKVPDRHVPAFETICTMSESTFVRLREVIAAAKPTDSLSAVVAAIDMDLASGLSDPHALLDAVVELGTLGSRSQTSVRRVAERVAAYRPFVKGEDPGNRFSKRIESLLNCDFVRLRSKASYVGSEHERLFVSAQIITDLRPLFSDDVSGYPEPEGALLSHTLSLHIVRSDGRHDNLYVVLDENDLESLRQVIKRARRKAGSLKDKLESSGLIYMRSDD